MSFDVTILAGKIEGIKTAFQNGRFVDAMAGALNTGNGLLQQRVFQQNNDIEGNNFGSYVGAKRKVRLIKSQNKTQNKRNQTIAGIYLTAYQRKRAKLGRQTNHKDLEFTGGLRRSIETAVENENAVILAFNNDEAAKIAHGQENQITNIREGRSGTTRGQGVRIFRLNKSEKEEVVQQGKELIIKILKP